MSQPADDKINDIDLRLIEVENTVNEIKATLTPAAAQIAYEGLTADEVDKLEDLLEKLAKVDLVGFDTDDAVLLKKYLRLRARHGGSPGGMAGMICGASGMICGASGMICGASGMVCWIE